MKRFIKKIVVFFLPIWLLFIISVLIFVIFDPFMLIGDHRGYIKTTNEYIISPNRDFYSTELFIKNYPKQNYNSFIFGNSRAFFYKIETWNKYIEGNCFQYSAPRESLYSIEGKIDFLNKRNVPIKNALIVLDFNTLSQTTNSDGHFYIKHPLISGESYFVFYKEMFLGIFPKATMAYVDLILTGKRKKYMEYFGIGEVGNFIINQNTNQFTHYQVDSMIEKDINEYYKNHEQTFYTRDTIQGYENSVIGTEQKELLTSINSILKSQNTNYKIVISPAYDQLKLAKSDLDYLNNLFGESNVFDFSGQNKYTNDYRNYYETVHYRPNVADDIMRVIYEGK